MILVKATREGLIGGKTSTGYVVETCCPFVALPALSALRQWVRVTNPTTSKTTRALVLDIGPWNEHDDAYVWQPATFGSTGQVIERKGVRPAAESGFDTRGRMTNLAGIDLGEYVWTALGMTDNTLVAWEFD